jgi:hypothetical protein
MTAINCEKHGLILGRVGYACKHIEKNIVNSVEAKCIQVRLRTTPGDLTKMAEEDKKVYTNVTFCLTCYDDKQLSTKMKLKLDWDIINKAIDDFQIVFTCPHCLAEYVERNKLN